MTIRWADTEDAMEEMEEEEGEEDILLSFSVFTSWWKEMMDGWRDL